MDFPQNLILPPFISSYMRQVTGPSARVVAGATGTAVANWPATDQAIYVPLILPWPYPVRRVFWANGSVLGNSDIGIYTQKGTLLWSAGSTAQAGASALQFVSPASAPFVLPAGAYWMAYANDGTTNRGYGATLVAANARVLGLYTQASARPLPASATFATFGTQTLLPLIGITRLAS